MADVKISGLPAATTPLAGTEVLPIVQSGSTVKVANNDLRPKQIQSNATSGVLQIAGPTAAATRVMTVPDANFTAARTDAANSFTGDQTLSTGNLVQGTAAKGVNFTANTGAAGKTSQLLNWYEEGTWTPTITSYSGTITSVTGNVGSYTRVGRSITCVYNFTISNNGTGAGLLFVTGLPFVGSQSVVTYYSAFGYNRTTGMSIVGEYNPSAGGGNGRISLYRYDGTYPVATGNTCTCVVTYEI